MECDMHHVELPITTEFKNIIRTLGYVHKYYSIYFDAESQRLIFIYNGTYTYSYLVLNNIIFKKCCTKKIFDDLNMEKINEYIACCNDEPTSIYHDGKTLNIHQSEVDIKIDGCRHATDRTKYIAYCNDIMRNHTGYIVKIKRDSFIRMCDFYISKFSSVHVMLSNNFIEFCGVVQTNGKLKLAGDIKFQIKTIDKSPICPIHCMLIVDARDLLNMCRFTNYKDKTMELYIKNKEYIANLQYYEKFGMHLYVATNQYPNNKSDPICLTEMCFNKLIKIYGVQRSQQMVRERIGIIPEKMEKFFNMNLCNEINLS